MSDSILQRRLVQYVIFLEVRVQRMLHEKLVVIALVLCMRVAIHAEELQFGDTLYLRSPGIESVAVITAQAENVCMSAGRVAMWH